MVKVGIPLLGLRLIYLEQYCTPYLYYQKMPLNRNCGLGTQVGTFRKLRSFLKTPE